jgi:hypothetical protein
MGTTIEQLRERVHGAVITPEDADYDDARAVYNAMIDKRPRSSSGRERRRRDGGGRPRARERLGPCGARRRARRPGFGTCDDGVVIDLSTMRGVRVDPRSRTARAEGGATLGDFNAATHAFGLATTGGIISTTGLSGLTLGGGIGYLSRGYGLSLDNLISADVVTADGRFVVASDRENDDLFWALRGGGGNFGAVTALEFRLHPVDMVYGGPMFFELDAVGDLLRWYREYIADAPEAFGGFPAFQIAPPLPFIPEDRHGDTFIAFVACWSGPIEQGEAALKPVHDVASVVAEHVGAMPYPALNSAFDGLVPPGLQHYWKANFVTELTDDIIDAHLQHGPNVPAVNSTMHIYPINGAVHRVGATETAFAHREANFATVIAGCGPTRQTTRRTRSGSRITTPRPRPVRGERLRQLHGE